MLCLYWLRLQVIEKIEVPYPVTKVIDIPEPYPVERVVEEKVPKPYITVIERPRPYPVQKVCVHLSLCVCVCVRAREDSGCSDVALSLSVHSQDLK